MADISEANQARLSQLAQLHLEQAMPPERHAELLRRLTAARPARGVPKTPRVVSRHYLLGGLGVGLAAAAATWALWSRSVPLSPEPVYHSGAAAAAFDRGVRTLSCAAAHGDDPALWIASEGVRAPARDRRYGGWVHFRNDGSQGQPQPIHVGRLEFAGEVQPALEVQGPASPGWGAKLTLGMRAQPVGSNGVHLDCYDASAYRGVRFRASGTGIVQVVLQSAESIPRDMGGTCTDKCWFSASHAIALGGSAQEFEIPWRQFGPDDVVRSVVPQLMMIDFVIQATDAPYRLTLADVAFISASAEGK